MAHYKTGIITLWTMAVVLAACGGSEVSKGVEVAATQTPESEQVTSGAGAETGGDVWRFSRFRALETLEPVPPLGNVEIRARDNTLFLMVELAVGSTFIPTIVSRVRMTYDKWHEYEFKVQAPTELPAGQSVRFRVYDVAVVEKSYDAGEASRPEPDFVRVRFVSPDLGQSSVEYATPAGLAVDDSWFPPGWRTGGADEAHRGAFAAVWPSDKSEAAGHLQGPATFFDFHVPEQGTPDQFVVAVEVQAVGLASAYARLIEFDYRKKAQ